MIPLLTFFAGSLLATLILGVFSSRAYDKGWADCETYQRRHYLRIIDRLASEHRLNIARVIGTMAPCPESDEVAAERERRA